MTDLDNFFNPKSIAIIGASREPGKVGFVVLNNLILSKYRGKIYPINPDADRILDILAYKSIKAVKDKIDLAIIAVPANIALNVIKECGEAKVKNIIILTAGFGEISKDSDKKLKESLKKYKIRAIGPNCLGLLDTNSNVDTLFIPRNRLQRPNIGGISLICQSGAVGSTILDLSTRESLGFSKFVSYGNALDVDESDLIDYLEKDETTKVICLYFEGVKDGNKFFKTLSKTKKPIIALKGGISSKKEGSINSHTGFLTGSYEVYKGILKQTNVILANDIEELCDFARIFDNTISPKGKRIQIVTNAGGFGVLAKDAVEINDLELAELSAETKKVLSNFPKYYIISNPLDLTGSARTEDFELAIDTALKDNKNDIVLAIILTQIPTIEPRIVKSVVEICAKNNKPLIVVTCGGDFAVQVEKNFMKNRLPCYNFPKNAVNSIKRLCDYYIK